MSDIVYSGGDYGSQFVERLEGIRIIGYVAWPLRVPSRPS